MRYRTEQREALDAYLKANAARQFTIEEHAEALQRPIGKSTVYRLVRELQESGRVRRFQLGQGRHVVYQYLPTEACTSHLHLKCVSCGRMMHLDGAVSDFLTRQIMASNRFALDDRLTTLYGRCAGCAAAEPDGEGK